MAVKVLDGAQVFEPTERWTVSDAAELYDVNAWGKGYFSVGANGHLWVHPAKDNSRGIDLKELVDKLVLRGIHPPILIRFGEILKHRLGEIHGAFQNAIQEHGYKGEYRCVFPIKVNQQRQVVEEVFEYGRPYHFGLEAGSKPELLAVMALADNDTPIICNGFKDDEYIEMAMHAKKIGRQIIPVVEKFTELDLIIKHAERMGVRPRHRCTSQTRQPRFRTVEVVGWLPIEVRIDDQRGRPCARNATCSRHGGLHAASAFPPRQPDHEHPAGEGRR